MSASTLVLLLLKRAFALAALFVHGAADTWILIPYRWLIYLSILKPYCFFTNVHLLYFL